MAAADVTIVRVYEDPGRDGSERRVLVDRLWPRGLKKESVDFDEWTRDAAPSAELRRWYGHAPERFSEFTRRYRDELRVAPASTALVKLRHAARNGRLVLLTATRDVARSGAEVLREAISEPSPGGHS